MVKHTPLLLSLIGLMTLNGQTQAKSTHYVQDDPWFNSMHASMRSMHDRMVKSMQEMQQIFEELSQTNLQPDAKSAEKQTLILDASDTQVLITLDVPGALADSMKAERNLDTIVIEIPQEVGNTTIRISAQAISVEHSKEEKSENGSQTRSHAYMERTLPHAADMSGDISLEHIEETNTLHIALDRKRKKKAPEQLTITKK